MRRALSASLLALTTVAAGCVRVPPPRVTYTFEVRGRDNISALEPFAILADFTLNDDRGWSLGGTVAFERVPAGGDFTLWLSAPVHLPRFSGICTSDWSCTVGRNVIINERNWLGATPAWRALGGALRDYQHMVVNHEVGHWLGFGHAGCGGPGRPAPVMQQQSKGLQGCAPNPWPTPGERQQAAGARGVPIHEGHPVGAVDAVVAEPGRVHVGGWALDPDTLDPVAVHVYLGSAVTGAVADRPRPDVAAAHPPYGDHHGYDASVPAGPGLHDVCVYALDAAPPGANALLACGTVAVPE